MPEDDAIIHDIQRRLTNLEKRVSTLEEDVYVDEDDEEGEEHG
jgi:hypothetical protein